MPEQAQSDEKIQAKKTETAVINTFEALKDDPALAVAGALLPFYKSKQNLLWTGGAVAALGLLAILWFSMGTGDSRIAASEKAAEPSAASVAAPSKEPNAPTSAPTVKAATEPTTSAVAPAGAVQAPAATQLAAVTRKIRIRVETSPEGAALSLDGASVANPFDIWTEQSGDHKIDARANGYDAISRSITFDKNQIVYLSLPRAKAAPIPKVAPVRRPATKRTATAQTRSRRATPTRRATAQKSRVTETRSRGAGFISSNPY